MTLDPPPPRPPRPTARSGRPLVIAAVVLVAAIGSCGVVIFLWGQDLFGSDEGTIDDYNQEVLDSCEVPPDSTLVRTYVLGLHDFSGHPFRSMSYVYASPLDAEELAAFYGLAGPGVMSTVAPERACRFGQHPLALVLGLWTPGDVGEFDPTTESLGLPAAPDDGFWAGDGAAVEDLTAAPPGTHSFVRLRVAQREEEGLLGVG